MSSFLDMEPKMPSHTDKLINQYIQNNQKQIHNTKNTGETTIIKIPVLDAVKDYGVEFGLGLASLYTTAKGKLYNEPESATLSEIEKIYNDNPHEQSLEAVLFDSALSQSKNTPAMIHPSSATPSVIPKKESTSVHTSSSYVKEKAQTWEGAEYLAGTIGISVLGAFVPFGRGKSVTQAVKPTLKATPQSPNNLAYLLKTTAQEPKIITKKVTVADGGSFDVIDFDAMKNAKITPHTPTISEKIQKRPNKFKKELSDKVDQTIGKEIRKLEFKNTMYQHELEKFTKTAKPKDATSKKPSRDNPISKASRKLKFENDMYHHNLEKSAPKTIETPMLDKLLGKSSRYVKTSVAINNKKIKEKSTQIKDTVSDTISDNIVDPVSKKTKPVGKFLKKVKVSKDINEHNLKKLLKDSAPKEYDPIGSMKSTEIKQDVLDDIIKKIKDKKSKLTKPQKAESGWEYDKANKESENFTGQSSKSSSATGQILETKPSKASSKVKQPSKVKSTKKQGDITVTEQALHQNRPKIPTPMLDELLGTKSIQSDSIKHDVTPKTHQTTSVLLDNLLKQNPKLDDLLGGKSKKKQKAILYDLLVQEGKIGTKGQQDYSFVFDHTQKLATEQTPKTTQRTRTKTTKLPVSIKIPEIGIRKNHTPEKKRKGAAKYSIWNVDADNIGTLPGEELVTSESTKIFKDLDKRQKAHNKPTNKSKNTTRKTTKKAIKKPAKKKSSKGTKK